MSRPTFRLASRDGTRAPLAVSYRRLSVTVAGVVHALALHRISPSNQWAVSDPKSGARILVVTGSYKGMPVHSGSFGEEEIHHAAVAQVVALAEKTGPARFNEVIAKAILRADTRDAAPKSQACDVKPDAIVTSSAGL